MRPELARAQRRADVRSAARDWRKAGRVDEETSRAIESRYPSDRVEKGPVWRALIFLFSCVILSSFFALVVATTRPPGDGLTILLTLFGVALAVATEFQQGPLRFDGTGGEAATSFLSLSFLTAASANALPSFATAPRIGAVLALAGILFAAGWWRWGFPIYALAAAVFLFFCASVLVPFPRLGWIALAAVLALLAGALQDRAELAPAHRAGMTLVLAAGLAAAYAAVNLYSLDRGILEELRPGASAAKVTGAAARTLAAALTALFPAALLAAGVLRRRRLLLDLGIAFAALSLVTLRAYVRLGPLWLVLTEAGAGLVALAFGTEKLLARSPNRERAGLTADPLLENEGRSRLATAFAASAMLSPDARPAEPGRDFSAGGGGFGGGGASGEL